VSAKRRPRGPTAPPKPRRRKRKPLRPLDKQGEYRRCRIGLLGWRSCPGEFETKGGMMRRHTRCGGDGWIRIGTKRAPRRRGAPAPAGGRPPRARRPRGTGRNRRRASATTGVAGVAWEVADQLVGATGAAVVLVVYGLIVALKLFAAEAANDRRTASA
jgi:hypothetical protein